MNSVHLFERRDRTLINVFSYLTCVSYYHRVYSICPSQQYNINNYLLVFIGAYNIATRILWKIEKYSMV